MVDMEKVIKGLEILRDICNAKSNMAIGNGKIAWAGYANSADDALALLKEQQKQRFFVDSDGKITPLPIQPQWISVKDRLPDAAGYECLVCAVNENYNQTHVFIAHTGYGEPGWWTGNVHYMSRVTSPSDNRLHPALNVTHWMPLPEPPEEVKQEPVEPIKLENWWKCPSCSGNIVYNMKYCPGCGKKVKWK